jgi:tRNA uridine 5-carboxymethylaminomethyl modification enzyme
MFTSRAEYRTLLRQDNADLRLTEKSNQIGLASSTRLKRVEKKKEESSKMIYFIQNNSYTVAPANEILQSVGSSPVTQSDKLFKLLSRPEINLERMLQLPEIQQYIKDYKPDQEVLEQVEIDIKYSGYINKEKDQADKLKRLETLVLDPNLDYNQFQSLSIEAREKLNKIKPTSISQASRISGITPSDISILLVYLGR